VYDYGEDPSGPYIVMELIDGEDLATILRRSGTLPPRQVARIGAGVARLRIVSTAELYRFSYAVGDEAFHDLGDVETRYLSSEVADGFTGVFVGMFATGNGKESSAPADFDWFEYKRLAKTTSLLRFPRIDLVESEPQLRSSGQS
jgi:alpha-N-arabinofuranosidase